VLLKNASQVVSLACYVTAKRFACGIQVFLIKVFYTGTVFPPSA